MLEHRSVLRHDPFRFTSAQTPWVDHEWLFQLVVAALERAGGFDALGLFQLGLTVLIALAVALTARRAGASLAVAVVIALAPVLVVRARLLVRPELFTFAFVALLLSQLDGLRRRPSPLLAVGIVALVGLWSNFHPGVLAAPILIGAFVAGTRVPPHWGGKPTDQPLRWTYVFGLPLAALLALGANPFGYAVLHVPSKIGEALAAVSATNPDWASSWQVPRPFWMLLVVVWVITSLLAWRRRRLDFATTLVALATLPLAVAFVRNQPLFAIAAAVSLGHSTTGWQPRWGRAVAATALAAVSVWCLAGASNGPLRVRGNAPQLGWGLSDETFPKSLVDRITTYPDLGNLYHDPVWGGYLLWRTFPPRQIFIDTRNEVGPELLREVGQARQNARLWVELLARFDIDAALVRFDSRRVPVFDMGADGKVIQAGDATIHRLLFPSELFALVDFDDRAMLLVRRTPERTARLAEEEYRVLHPEDLQGTIAAVAGNGQHLDRLRLELARKPPGAPGATRLAPLHEALAALSTRPATSPSPPALSPAPVGTPETTSTPRPAAQSPRP